MNTKSFGWALARLKEGKLVSREGWNGKRFIFMRPEDSLPAATVIHIVKSLPKEVKDYYANRIIDLGSARLQEIKFTAYLCLKADDDSIVNGWMPSQEDMMGLDWGPYTERHHKSYVVPPQLNQSQIHAGLLELISRIENCGGSVELTDAVTLASDLRQAVGDIHNPASVFAAARVVHALEKPVHPELPGV